MSVVPGMMETPVEEGVVRRCPQGHPQKNMQHVYDTREAQHLGVVCKVDH